MNVPIILDKRYKLNNEKIADMRILRKNGYSLNKLAKLFKVNVSTVFYWTDDKFRKKQREKIAKHKSNNKKRTLSLIEQKKLFTKEIALQYIKKEIETYYYTNKDVLILGVSMKKHWIPYLETNYPKGLNKISEADN